MCDREPVTDLLKKLSETDSHEYRLVKYFEDQARQYAEKKINQSLQKHISPTDIASTALRNCLLQGRKGNIIDGQHFEALLKRIVSCKVATAVEAAKRQKRDVLREVSFQASDDDQSGSDPISQEETKTLGPEEQAIVKELSQEAIHLIWEEEEKVRLIGLFSLLYGFSAGQIQEYVRPLYEQEDPPKQCPSIRSIQETLKKLRRRLRKKLEADL